MSTRQSLFVGFIVVALALSSAALGIAAPQDALLVGAAGIVVPNYPGLPEFVAELKRQREELDICWFPLYDTILYPTAGLTSMRFFQNGIGSGVTSQAGATAGNVKTVHDTNVESGNGKLASTDRFFVHSLEVEFVAGSSNVANTYANQAPTAHAAASAATVQAGENDVQTVQNSGHLLFRVGNKDYLSIAPLKECPPQTRIELDTAEASTSATAALTVKGIARAGGRLLMFAPGIAIDKDNSFTVNLSWPAVVATPSGFNGRIKTTLNGWLFRPMQ